MLTFGGQDFQYFRVARFDFRLARAPDDYWILESLPPRMPGCSAELFRRSRHGRRAVRFLRRSASGSAGSCGPCAPDRQRAPLEVFKRKGEPDRVTNPGALELSRRRQFPYASPKVSNTERSVERQAGHRGTVPAIDRNRSSLSCSARSTWTFDLPPRRLVSQKTRDCCRLEETECLSVVWHCSSAPRACPP
jgi:hypothetical protein